MQADGSEAKVMGWRTSRQPAALVALALIVAYFGLVVWLAPHGPFGDDLDISNSVEQARAATNPWPILWAQHNEHRLLVTKLVFWGQRATTGTANYTLLSVLGGLFLVPIFLILAKRALKLCGGPAAGALIFAAAMTFNYSSADSMLWAMAALSNYGVIAFGLATLWMLEKNQPGWTTGALACALLATVSQGNGILALILGTAFLATDRRWGGAWLWLIVSIASVTVYLWGYKQLDGLSNPLISIQRPVDILLFALTMSGSALGYPLESVSLRLLVMALSAALGCALWGVTFYGFARNRFQTHDPLLWFNVFLLGGVFLAAISRQNMGLIQALVPRYHIISCLLLASCLLLMAGDKLGPLIGAFTRRAMPALVACGLLYVAASSLTLWRMHTFYAAHVGVSYTPPLPPR